MSGGSPAAMLASSSALRSRVVVKRTRTPVRSSNGATTLFIVSSSDSSQEPRTRTTSERAAVSPGSPVAPPGPFVVSGDEQARMTMARMAGRDHRRRAATSRMCRSMGCALSIGPRRCDALQVHRIASRLVLRRLRPSSGADRGSSDGCHIALVMISALEISALEPSAKYGPGPHVGRPAESLVAGSPGSVYPAATIRCAHQTGPQDRTGIDGARHSERHSSAVSCWLRDVTGEDRSSSRPQEVHRCPIRIEP